jgi:hypothetical protein
MISPSLQYSLCLPKQSVRHALTPDVLPMPHNAGSGTPSLAERIPMTEARGFHDPGVTLRW